MPKAISLSLARDINDIGAYYSELGVKLGAPVPKERRKKKPTSRKLRVKPLQIGDAVRIVSKAPGDEFRDTGLDTYWVDDMMSYLGQRATITRSLPNGDYELDIDNGQFAWVRAWLVPGQ